MKKRILSILLAGLLCMGVSGTAMAKENSPFIYNTYVNDAELESIPEMWVGDLISISPDAYTYEILEGSENVEIGQYNIKFLNVGKVKICATSKEEPEEVLNYEFTIVPAQTPYVEYLIPKNVKIGHVVDDICRYHNCLLPGPGLGYSISQSTWDNFSLYAMRSTGWGGSTDTNPETRTLDCPIYGILSKPGTYQIAASIDEGNPYTFTVEEPVINTNLPKNVQVGTEMEMISSLDNTELKNMKVFDVKHAFDNQTYQITYPFGYQPRVEVITGNELVERSDGDYSNILSTSEKIKFTGAGTVTFKVTYELLPIADGVPDAIEEEAIYNPEKTFTVEVVSDSIINNEVSDKTDENVKVDTDGLDWTSICKDYKLDSALGNVKIDLEQEEVARDVLTKLKQQADKDNYSIKTSYEILMKLSANGNKIADLTDNFGKLQLTLQVGKDYAGQKAIVYQFHDGKEIIPYNGLSVNVDGTVTITVNKLSAFAIAVADKQDPNGTGGNTTNTAGNNKNEANTSKDNTTKDNTVKDNTIKNNPVKENSAIQNSSSNTGSEGNTELVNPVQNTNNISSGNSVKTGDHTNLMMWIALCVAALGTVLFMMKKKHFKTTR